MGGWHYTQVAHMCRYGRGVDTETVHWGSEEKMVPKILSDSTDRFPWTTQTAADNDTRAVDPGEGCSTSAKSPIS
jgi:hypothetical protein